SPSPHLLQLAGSRRAVVGGLCIAVGAHELGIPAPARLDAPRLRLWIDGDEAEVLAVAVGPLEVVEQCPDETALNGDTLLSGRDERLKVLAQIGDAPVIARVLRGGDVVLEGGTELGHQQRRWPVCQVYLQQDIAQPLRIDLPAHMRITGSRYRHDDFRARRR